jgi:tRNA(His) 5'-end guanylyltransferase
MIQDMLHEERGINWNDYETRWKRGVAWVNGNIDWDIPILKGEDRSYVEDLIYVGE